MRIEIPITRAPQMTEAEFMIRTMQLAKACGWMCYHTHDSRRSEAGFPDVVMVKGPTILFVEFKSASGKLRPEQTTWIQRLSDAAYHPNGRVFVRVWRPGEHDDEIEQMLTEKGR